jgi:hypothetical protein
LCDLHFPRFFYLLIGVLITYLQTLLLLLLLQMLPLSVSTAFSVFMFSLNSIVPNLLCFAKIATPETPQTEIAAPAATERKITA